MAIYVDQLRNWGWRLGPSCHLFTDGPNEELHAFAARLGLKRDWFQRSASGPHYDLTGPKRTKAVQLGAIEATDREMVDILRNWRRAAVARIEAATSDEERGGKRYCPCPCCP